MTPACACSIALTGAAGYVIEARADIADGPAGMNLAYLPDTARDRIRAAIVNSGEQWPQRKINVGLSPASMHGYSSAFDTAVAVAVLAAAGVVPAAALGEVLFFAELGLDGRLRPVQGALPAVAAAGAAGFGAIVVAVQDAAGRAPGAGIRVIPAGTLAALAVWLRAGQAVTASRPALSFLQSYAGRRAARRARGRPRRGADPDGHRDLGPADGHRFETVTLSRYEHPGDAASRGSECP